VAPRSTADIVIYKTEMDMYDAGMC